MSDPKKSAGSGSASEKKDGPVIKRITDVEDAKVLPAQDKADKPAAAEKKADAKVDAKKPEPAKAADAKSAKPSAQKPAAKEPKRGSSAWPLLIGLLAGGVGGGAVLIGAPMLGDIAPKDYALARGADLEALEAQQLAQDEALFKRIAVLENGAESFASAQAEQEKATAALMEELQTLSGRLKDSGSETEAVRARISALENTLSSIERSQDTALRALREQIASIAAAPVGAPLAAASPDGAAAPSGLAARVALLEGAQRRLAERLDALTPSGAAGGYDALAQRIADLESRPNAVGADAALGVAYAALAQAVAGASPFEAELKTFESVADVKAPAAIGDPAARGLPSRARLIAGFPEAGRAALAALEAEAAQSDDSWGGFFSRKVAGLVTVRPIDEQEGHSPAAVLSRAGARVSEGEMAAALTEIDTLPITAKEAMGQWLRDVKERVQAEAALDSLRASLLGGAAQ